MEYLPWYVATLFLITFFITVFLFSKAAGFSKFLLLVLLPVITIQSALGIGGYYSNLATMTARFPFIVVPLFLFFASLFFTKRGKALIDSLDLRILTLLHVIRIGVEITLFWLYTRAAIPQAMTFEGRNFDIVSGLTAPLIYYFGFVKLRLPKQVILLWNIACALLLLNVVTNAFLSLPGRFMNFGFEHPNIAVGHFPFLLLPAVVVPIVFFSHAAAIRQLIVHKSFPLVNKAQDD